MALAESGPLSIIYEQGYKSLIGIVPDLVGCQVPEAMLDSERMFNTDILLTASACLARIGPLSASRKWLPVPPF